MPELPDVEIWKRYVDATSLHAKIEDIDLSAPAMLEDTSPRTLRRRLVGGDFDRTMRHGKYLFLAMREEAWLMLHFGMTGRLAYRKACETPPAHTRLSIRFANGSCLACIWQRKLGAIGIVGSPGGFVRKRGFGPDALSAGAPLADFRQMLAKRRGAIKAALMDQQFIAGIGNVYSDEMLFQSGIHPRASASNLDQDQTALLHRSMRRVLRTAIRHRAEPESMPNTWLLPSRQEGKPCPRCGTPLEGLTVSGRHAIFCPRRQKPRS